MTTRKRRNSPAVASPRETIDVATRLRIAAHLRELMWLHHFENDAAMAEAVGCSRSAMNRYLKGERNVGFDVALAIHRQLHVSLDWLSDKPPEDRRFEDPHFWPTPENPLAPGRPRRRRKARPPREPPTGKSSP